MKENSMTKNLRVLYVDYSVGFGGAAKSLGLTVENLPHIKKYMLTSQTQGIINSWYGDMRVWRFRRYANYKTKSLFLDAFGKKVTSPFLRTAWSKTLAITDILVGLLCLGRITYLAKKLHIDLIHINTGFSPLEAILAARLANVPCIAHLRGFVEFRGKLLLTLMQKVSHVIGVSDAVSRSVPSDKVLPAKVSTIYDPVNIKLFDDPSTQSRGRAIRDRWGLHKSDVSVGIFGRVIPWKGHLEFVQACLQVLEGNKKLKVFIVGDESDGCPGYLHQLTNMIALSSFRDRFVFTGYQEDVEPYYCAMDLVVHASIEPEPFGMVVPEGMAARKAVIATDAGGPREVIQSGVDGLLVPPGDVSAMGKAIEALADDPDAREAMGVRAYEKVVSRFSSEKIASNLNDVYRKVLLC